MEIIYTYSPGWLLLIFGIAIAISYWLYRRDKILGERNSWLPRLLAVFRTISLSLIAFFLLEPMMKTEEREIQRPIIAIAVDNSESILNGSDSVYYKTELANEIQKLAASLDDEYDVELFSFDEKVSKDLRYDYSGKISNLSNLIDEFETRYYNRNLGAIVLASDGNYNQGLSPIYNPISLNAPLYSILLGDTGKSNDLAINEIITNSIAFLGDDFPIEINVGAEGMKGNDYRLEVRTNGTRVFEKKGEIDAENWFQSIPLLLSANQVGVQRYTVELFSDGTEKVKQNNSAVFYIKVLDERLKIAIISSTPHPDVATWFNALQKNKNYEVDVFEADKFDASILEYSLFILYQLPGKLNHTALFDQIKQAKIPYIVQVGLNTNLNLLNQVLKGDYTLKAEQGIEETFKARFNTNFSLFLIDDQLIDHQQNLPPLAAPLVNFSSKEVYQKLMTKQIGQLDTELPIWVLSESDEPRSALIIGEGLWRWRINSYLEFENHEVFDEFLQQSAKYLVRKGGNKRFIVDVNEEYFEGTRIKMNAKLLDPSMEPSIGGDIELELTNEEGEKFIYSFLQSGTHYSIDLGIIEAGDYSFKATANLGEEVFVENGKFTVMKRMLEQKDTRANAALMYQWSENTGGELYYPDQIDAIQKNIRDLSLSSISYQTEHFSDLIRMSWLLILISLFLSVEWFLRRYFGSY